MTDGVSFARALLVTFGVSFLMFGIAGGLLFAFWQTFGDEEHGPVRRRRLTRFTVLVLALVILVGFALWTSYQ